jgi:hypothetical protein
MKAPLFAMALLIGFGSSMVMAGPAAGTSKEAKKLEARVEKDATAGLISQDDASKYKQELDHVIDSMTSQSSTTSERRGMKEQMARISAALDAVESPGGATAAPSPK